MGNPRYWCRPLNPSRSWVERYALACRNYVIDELSKRHKEIGYHVIRSNVFCFLLDQLDPESPDFRHELREITNAMVAALAIVQDPAF